MYRTFNEHRVQLDNSQFNSTIHAMCETLVLTGVSFKEFWLRIGLPTMVECSTYSTEEELIELWAEKFADATGLTEAFGLYMEAGPFDFGDPALNNPAYQGLKNPKPSLWQRMSQGLKGMGQKVGAGISNAVNKMGPQVSQNYDPAQASTAAPAQPSAQDPKQQRLGVEQGKVDQVTNRVKSLFGVAMKDFMKNVGDSAKQSGDAYQWKVAQMLQQKVMGILQNFKPNAKYGDGSWKKDFNQQASSMQQGQQASRTADLKNRLNTPKPQAAPSPSFPMNVGNSPVSGTAPSQDIGGNFGQADPAMQVGNVAAGGEPAQNVGMGVQAPDNGGKILKMQTPRKRKVAGMGFEHAEQEQDNLFESLSNMTRRNNKHAVSIF